MPAGYEEDKPGATNTTDAGGDSSDNQEKSTGSSDGGDAQAAAEGDDNGKLQFSLSLIHIYHFFTPEVILPSYLGI